MARNSTITAQQIAQIYQLCDLNKSQRAIAAELGLSHAQVRGVVERRANEIQQQKVAAIVSSPVAQQTVKSVFNIVEGLEFCLQKTQELLTETDAPLKDQVAVRSEMRQLFSEARSTLETIYNIRMFDEFVNEVATILEESTPGAKRRIFERLEQSASASGVIGLFAERKTAGTPAD